MNNVCPGNPLLFLLPFKACSALTFLSIKRKFIHTTADVTQENVAAIITWKNVSAVKLVSGS